MAELEHEQIDFRTRRIAQMMTDPNTHIVVAHAYDIGVRECACGAAHTLDEGLVLLQVRNTDGAAEEDAQDCHAYLAIGEALVLAQALQRAAQLVLQTHEQPADFEHEMAILAAHDKQDGDRG